MKRQIVSGTLALLAGTLLAAHATPKDDVTAAAKKLADKDNYAWKRTTEDAGGGRSGSRPSEGEVERTGTLWLSMTLSTPRRSPDTPIAMRDNPIEGIKKGEKVAIKTADGWQSFSEATSGGTRGSGHLAARLVQILKPRPRKPKTSPTKSRNSSRMVTCISGDSRNKRPSRRSSRAVAVVGPTRLKSAGPQAR